jgi:uncharacterized protein (TIGR02996 family)
MSDETALLRAIAANPDEDTPRLAFADYIEEQGNTARAEFIRGQVELARLKEDSPRRREIAFRCRQLLDAHEEEWLDPREVFERDWAWSRGFVETFSTTPADLSYGHDGIFRAHPFRRVWVWKLDGSIDGLHLIPNDNHITALDLIGSNLNISQLKKLAQMTHLPHLRELGLMFNDLRDTAVKVLCGEAFFQRLERIRLGANPFTWKGRNQLLKHFRDKVSFAFEREPDHLYAIREEYLNAGWGSEFTQLLIYSVMDEQWLAVFDHAGNLLHTERRSVASGFLPEGVSRGAARDLWLRELGHTPAAIRVKRFHLPHRLNFHDFPPQSRIYDQVEYRPRGPLGEDIVEWLNDGRFQFDLGGHVLQSNREGAAIT